MTTQNIPQSPELTTKELYLAVTQAHDLADYSEIEAIHVLGFAPEGSDAAFVAKTLRGYGYSLTKPSKRKPQPSKSKRNFNAGNLSSQFLTVGGA